MAREIAAQHRNPVLTDRSGFAASSSSTTPTSRPPGATATPTAGAPAHGPRDGPGAGPFRCGRRARRAGQIVVLVERVAARTLTPGAGCRRVARGLLEAKRRLAPAVSGGAPSSVGERPRTRTPVRSLRAITPRRVSSVPSRHTGTPEPTAPPTERGLTRGCRPVGRRRDQPRWGWVSLPPRAQSLVSCGRVDQRQGRRPDVPVTAHGRFPSSADLPEARHQLRIELTGLFWKARRAISQALVRARAQHLLRRRPDLLRHGPTLVEHQHRVPRAWKRAMPGARRRSPSRA